MTKTKESQNERGARWQKSVRKTNRNRVKLVSAWDLWAPMLAREMLAIMVSTEREKLKATVDAFQSRYCLSHELMCEVMVRTRVLEKYGHRSTIAASEVVTERIHSIHRS